MPDWKKFDLPHTRQVPESGFNLEVFYRQEVPRYPKAGRPVYGRNISAYRNSDDAWFNIENWTFDLSELNAIEQKLFAEATARIETGDWQRGKVYGPPCPYK